jgi:NAD(P)-dependent dehydrogenase (short-subunit alcohol dehydrogenase family)
MCDLQGKRILVTGGARGMGRSHVEHFSSVGARVLVADILDSAGEALVGELAGNDRDVEFAHLDVTSERDWKAVVARAEARWGGLDGLVNNAGVTGTWGGPEIEDLVAWNRTISVNQTGGYLGIRTAAPLMRRSGGGAIVNVSSILGFVGDGDYFAYSASKGALRQMTRAAALKYASDAIRVNSVCPGMVRTPMNDEEADADSYVSDTPLRRMAEPIEISRAVAFLLSDHASYITGSDLVIDGGYLAR